MKNGKKHEMKEMKGGMYGKSPATKKPAMKKAKKGKK